MNETIKSIEEITVLCTTEDGKKARVRFTDICEPYITNYKSAKNVLDKHNCCVGQELENRYKQITFDSANIQIDFV